MHSKLFINKLIFIFLLSLSFYCLGQEPVTIHLSDKTEVPDVEFYDVLEDTKGFIWLAAERGLYRYDGVNFKRFTHKLMTGVSVFYLKLDKKGRVWFTNLNGQFFYIENNEVKFAAEVKKDFEITESFYDFEIQENTILIAKGGVIYSYDFKTKEKNKIRISATKKHISRKPVKLNNTLLYLVDNTFFSYDFKNYNFQKFSTKKINLKGNNKSELFLFNKKLLVNASDYKKKSTLFFETTKGFKKIKTIQQEGIQRILDCFSYNNQLWLATNKGVYIFKLLDNSFVKVAHYLKDRFITKIIKDTNDNFWFTTIDDGVYIMPNIYLKKYSFHEKNINITTFNSLNDTDVLLGSTKGELFRVNLENDRIIDKFSFSNSAPIFAISEGRNKDSVYLSSPMGSYIFDKKTNFLHEFSISNNHASLFANAKSIQAIGDNKILFSNHQGSGIISINNGEFKKERLYEFKRSQNSFYDKEAQMYYLGYLNELICLDKEYRLTNIKLPVKESVVLSIVKTNNNSIWLATYQNGILEIKDKKVVRQITKKEGLLSNQIDAVTVYKNDIWIATAKGIQCFNILTNKFRNLTALDGYNAHKITTMKAFKEKLLYSTNKGLFVIHKDKVFKKKQLKHPYINEIQISNVVKKVKDEYKLTADKDRIRIKFNTNGFAVNKVLNYSYMVEGVYPFWEKLPAGSNEILINSLPKGKHIIKIKGVLDDTISKELQIKVDVKVLWYKSIWFYLGIMLLLLSAVYWGYRLKLKAKEKEKEQLLERKQYETERVFLKLENLRSQMNPHFIFNALNSIQQYVITNEKNLASDYLGQFADLIRKYLEQSMEATLSLEEEIATLHCYLSLEKIRFENRLEYQINVDKTLQPKAIFIPTMLIQPYIENALKHGLLHSSKGGRLTVSFNYTNEKDCLLCTIKDNGIGREKAQQIKKQQYKTHISFATKANQSRIDLLNMYRKHKIQVLINDLYDENNAVGTQVILKIPLLKETEL